MKPLFTGIFTKFTALPANSFYTALSGRLYSRWAPQNTAFPYAVVDIVSGIGDWNFTNDFDDIDLQISLFSRSTSETEIGNLLTYLRALYDDTALTVTGYTHLFMQYNQYWSLANPDEKIRQYTVQYNILLQK